MVYDDILRFMWPDTAAKTDAIELHGGGSVRIYRAGEEDAAGRKYVGAELEIDGVRRFGDVVFGAGGASSLTRYTALHVVHSPQRFLMDDEGRRIPQAVVSVPQELAGSVESLRMGAGGYECGVWLGDQPAVRRVGLLDRLLLERMERKCRDVERVFDASDGDWAQTLYVMLFRAMGGNRNREPYMELAARATYQMVLRERSSMELVEALLLGTSGLLEDCYYDDYIRLLGEHFLYLARKYGITPMMPGQWERSGVRAQNKPFVRILQLASFAARRDFMFDSVVACRSRADVHALFDTEIKGYWSVNPIPDGEGVRCPGRIGAQKADLLAINAVVPVMFSYGAATGKAAVKDVALELLSSLPAEDNYIVRGWGGMGVPVANACDSQALIQLKNEYCAKGECVSCRVGRCIIKMKGKAFGFR